MQTDHKSKLFRNGVIFSSTTLVACFYYFFDPALFHFGPPCLLHSTTGFSCWGCGGQRAFHELLHGNFYKAMQLNVLVFPAGLLAIYFFISELSGSQKPYVWLRKKQFRLATIALVVCFTIFRNL